MSQHIVAEIQPRSNSKARRSGCNRARPGYDRMSQPRPFEFIPIYNIPVTLLYTMRRVDCPDCGIKVEAVPWAQGKHACCDAFRHFLACWAKCLSGKETASRFNTSWETVCRSVKWVVDYGLKNRDLEDITAIGVDEVSDMWKPYLNVIARMLPAALNVLDRFHIAKKLGEAVDEVRRAETKHLKQGGYDPVLSKSRYCFLKRPANLTS
jgi:transposase